MTSNEIRNQFLDFFKEKEHRILPSAPVVPYDDPTLLFTNAGMNQFKDVFLGKGQRDFVRAVDTQKCIRVSGKHNDLEEVGRDTYHHTFFEMLGNWSLGDPDHPEKGYYKEEAIAWAWELLTEVWKLPKERLWATVYRTDDESFEIWKNMTDINPDHVLKFDEKDNFWEMGETGPCGPCSEIHINVGDDFDNPKWVNAGVEECIEIWNLVFIQFNRDTEGTLHDLPAKHVDTGMGFERIVAVLQNKPSNYDTDIFTPLIKKISDLAELKTRDEKQTVAVQVIADHIRTLTFAITDGATPGNEGRGYVLRRILRRAARFGRNINLYQPFLYSLVETLVDTMGEVFPEIKANKDNVKKIIKAEEVSFNKTLDRGIDLFEAISQKTLEKSEGSQTVISGDDVFKLYDTFGFPADLTNVMAEEKGITIDEERFNQLMQEQKERARGATKDKIAKLDMLESMSDSSNVPDSEFIGYDYSNLEGTRAQILRLVDGFLVLDKTPFYPESGGQIGDTGKIVTDDGTVIEIKDTIKNGNLIAHKYEGTLGNIGMNATAFVDKEKRWEIMRNHSATHLMHAALREVLGEHVQQSGSYVSPDRLRFDFTHFQKLNGEEIQTIENLVNQKIKEMIPREQHKDTPFEDAKKMGALMFFGDKYGDKVNVIQFGEFSKEFCGGTHVLNSSDIKYFKIVSESSISSGIRRIEAVTGSGVVQYIEELASSISNLNLRANEIENDIQNLQANLSKSDKKSASDEKIEENSSNDIEELSKLKAEFSNDSQIDVDDVKHFISVQQSLENKLRTELKELNDEKRKLEKEFSKHELQSKLGGIDSILNSPIDSNGIQLFRGKVDAANMDELKSIGDELRNKMKSGVGVMIAVFDEKVGIVCVVSDDLIKDKKIMAGNVVSSVAKIVGGGGGGRPHLATAGGRDISKIDEALNSAEEILRNM